MHWFNFEFWFTLIGCILNSFRWLNTSVIPCHSIFLHPTSMLRLWKKLSNNAKRNILDLLIAISNEYKLGKLLVIDIRWSLINLDVDTIEYYTFLAAATWLEGQDVVDWPININTQTRFQKSGRFHRNCTSYPQYVEQI